MSLMGLFKFSRQKILRFRESIFHGKSDPNPVACDFWLVCHEKDFDTAKLCIQAIKKFSLNPIQRIFFVSTMEPRPDWLDPSSQYIYENNIPGIIKAKQILNNNSYRGWIIQQLLKLSGIHYSERFVCIDCDTILVRPHLFYCFGETVLRLAYEYSPIYRPFERILGVSALKHLSFTCHMMPFQGPILKKLLELIELKTGHSWCEGVSKYAEMYGMVISEWDLYARYLIQNKHPYRLAPWVNQTVSYEPNMSLEDLLLRFGRTRLSISFHQSAGPLVLK
jgi:hypothetical protein